VHRGIVIIAVGLVVALVAGCGGGGGSSKGKVDPEVLLQQAKTTLDATSSVHFQLNGQNVSTSGTNLTGGEGDLARPDQLKGSFMVTVDGIGATVKVVSKGGVFVAQLPFQNHFTRTNPTTFGLTDPSVLLDPEHGLSNLLTSGTGTSYTGQVRYHGELLDEVTTMVPGSAIPVLPDAKPSEKVTMVVAINPDNHETREISLTGPFTSSTSNTTYVVILTAYNEPVSITLPPT
jgi:lipoprotein LprG